MAETSKNQIREPLQVTLREAAELLRYDERTIRRLIARGELAAIGRGKLRRIAMADLRAYQMRNRC
jgi:excisionase family DNA binding protein